jgi:cytoskeleton protein RodZ
MSIGAQLRASREARGLTLDAVARATRVQPRILAAIERDDVAAVPPRPFGRGFVKAYAAEMGLDPEQVTQDYFARFAPPPAAEASAAPAAVVSQARPHTWMYAVGVVGLAVGVALAFLARSPEPEPPPASALPAVGTSGTAAAPAPESTPTGVAPPMSIVLIAQRPAWVTATTDGHREVYRILTPGPPTYLTASREITIRVGDAGAITWRVNGREAGLMGRSGQVRDVRLTAENVGSVR